MDRRSFLALTGIYVTGISNNDRRVATIWDRNWKNRPKKKRHYSILQGFTDHQSTEFSVVVPKSQTFHLMVKNKKTELTYSPLWEKTQSQTFSPWSVLKSFFNHLNLHDPYELLVLSENGDVVERRDFGLLDLGRNNGKVAVLSCMNDGYHRPQIWHSLQEKAPDLNLFIGDNVYADFLGGTERNAADLTQLWERYVETRNTLEFYFLPKLIPTVAIWDDHDYGLNNADQDFEYKGAAEEVFQAFFAQSGSCPSLHCGPGISSCFQAFGQNFYMMDGRSYRSPVGKAGGSHFGKQQEQWLFDGLHQNPEPSWLIKGDQWFGSHESAESYLQSHPESFEYFLSQVQQAHSPVAFVSGDIHFSEIMEIEPEILGYSTLEITSSPMHSLSIPGWQWALPNSRRVEATGHYNFVILDCVAEGPRLQGNATAYKKRGNAAFSYDFDLFA